MSAELRLLAILWLFAAPMWGEDAKSADAEPDLPKPYREWLELVDSLITEEERAYFLGLDENFRRNSFIKAFWRQRDAYGDTEMVEAKVHWDERSAAAKSLWGSLKDARAQFFLVHGEPYSRCLHRTREVEVWWYDESNPDAKIRDSDAFYPAIFFKRNPWEAYRRWEFGISVTGTAVSRRYYPADLARLICGDGAVRSAEGRILAEPRDPVTVASLEIPEPSEEWVAAFASRTTDLPDSAARLAAELTLEFPGRHQQRTVAQGIVTIDRREAALHGTASEVHHQFSLLGELVRGDDIFESFRYRFELPARPSSTDPLALVFQRYLRPGEFRLILKLEDLHGRRFARIDRQIEVPDREREVDVARLGLEDSELFRFLAEANAATARGERSLRVLSPPGIVQTGMVRFQTVTVGEFDRVDFLLDKEIILTKRRAPYSVELDLGELPETHRLRVNGHDEGGQVLAADELILNPGGQRFRVHLTEPLRGQTYRDSLRAAVQVIAPEGKETERVEIFLGENRVATLYQPPFIQPIRLRGAELAYVRAVAYLSDGNSSEDLVFVNAPNIDEIDVHFVELYATVHDRAGRLIQGLEEKDFRVLEDGVEQRARRFEWVDTLPLATALLIDNSASMEDSLEKVGEAALTFVEQAIEPRDRAGLITFNHQPNVELRFTNDVEALSRQLEAMRASGGTALYDSLVFALHYFHGVKGQKALLLLSDGKDESSHFDFDSALEFARRAGVMIYAIALKEPDFDRKSRRVLDDLATETGGRAFFLEDLGDLEGIYASILEELRSQYLFAYQSSSAKDASEFRRIEVDVKVDGKRVEVRTMSGYYP